MSRLFYFFLCTALLLLVSCDRNTELAEDQIYIELCGNSELDTTNFSVLSFNRLSSTSFNSVSMVVNQLQPDFIGIQESYEIGKQIADRYNYCLYGNDAKSTAILSKYPVEVINDMYVKIILNQNQHLHFFNIHLPANPYQPYDIRDTLITTESQAIHQAEQTRGEYVDDLLFYVNQIDDTMPIVVTGDFNEPSHLDWVAGSENPIRFQIGDAPFTVNWPASNKMLNSGLIDAYRSVYTNPIDYQGYTWTPIINLNEVHDRIDFVYHNSSISVDSVFLIGPDNMSDIKISSYESDHRGVLVNFSFN
jgi:exodeoxyribonuclease-3